MKDFLRGVVFVGIFAVPFLSLYVANTHFFPYITGKNFGFRIIVEVIFAAWVLLAVMDADYRPKFSWVLTAFTGLTAVMLVASVFAYYPHTALWSNYERMDGFVMLVHVWGYLVVVASTLRTKDQWWWFLHTSLAVAVMVTLYGLNQLNTTGNINYRIDSTLGNSTYMGIYMLFHLGILGYLALQTRVRAWHVAYALLAIVFTFVLIQTGTRGTVIGLAVGSAVSIGYVALFGFRYPQVRKFAIGGCIAMVALAGTFVALRDTAPVQNNPTLARIANIDLQKDLEIRRIVWGMAIEGIKERPVLGWGIGNYNYIFNQNYDPRMYAQEQWFDRVHNLVLDWLIYGGVIGLAAYVLVFVSIFYYLVYRPWRYDDRTFTVLEQALLVGLLVGYTLHNLVVFDNLVSYVYFVIVMALIHTKVAIAIPEVHSWRFSSDTVSYIIAPVVVALLIVTVYTVNIPSRAAAKDIITAMHTNDMNERYEIFDRALTRGSFGQQEITEQFVQQAIQISQAENIAPETKARFADRAEKEINAMIERKPNDARLHVFASNYYRSAGDAENAERELELARALSPRKQSIILQQGALALSQGKTEDAAEFFRTAFRLDERYNLAREYYIVALFQVGKAQEASELVVRDDERFMRSFANSDFVAGNLNALGQTELLAELFEIRVTEAITTPQMWASLAFLYYQQDKIAEAIDALSRAKLAIPSFAPTATCIADNIEAGREPQEGCS